jgi:uncharacterized membrane protein YdcZ (DUF606 family)
MNSKTLGIILIAIGILMIAFTGFDFVTKKNVAELGPVNITKEKSHPIHWSPIVGVVVLLGGVFVVSRHKKVSS